MPYSTTASPQESYASKVRTPRVGETWKGKQRGHRGWVVRITRLSPTAVQFVCADGPGKSRGTYHWMGASSFAICFVPPASFTV